MCVYIYIPMLTYQPTKLESPVPLTLITLLTMARGYEWGGFPRTV